MAKPKSEEREYVLRTSQEELARLGFQHRVWSESAFAAWERAGFGPGQTLLDLGCGPGYTTLDLAQLTGPDGLVIALDNSPRFIRHLLRQAEKLQIQQIEARVEDAERISQTPNTIDGVYCRWMLCFVENPEACVRGIGRALKRGGRVAIQDYVHYDGIWWHPHHEIFDVIIRAVGTSWRRHGGDPNVAGRVPELLANNGFEILGVRALQRACRPNEALWHWPVTFFKNYLPVLIEMRLITPEQGEQFASELSKLSEQPNAVFCSPPMLEVIAEKR